LAWLRKGRKDYIQIREIVFNPSSSKELDEVIFSLLNDKSVESFAILGDYLTKTEIIQPTTPILNYKGDTINSLKVLIADHFVLAPDIEAAKDILLSSLTNFFTFDDLRKKIFNSLRKLNLTEIGAKHVLTLIWTTSPPIKTSKKIFFEVLPSISDNEKSNYLFWYLFTPEFVTQDFPTQFHPDIYKYLVRNRGESSAIYMLIQALFSEISKKISGWANYLGDYLTIFTNESLKIVHSKLQLILEHEFKDTIIENLQKILNVVNQADATSFLLTYTPHSDDPLSVNFIKHWKEHISSRLALRSKLIELLTDLDVDDSSHEKSIINQAIELKSSDKIKNMIREIEKIFESPADITNNSSIFTDIELLTEVLEWRFDELLTDFNFTRFDHISDFLLKMPNLINIIPENSQLPDTITQLLLFTSQEAVHQYNFRKNLVQKIIMNQTFQEQAIKREEKYDQYGNESPDKLKMKFNLIIELIIKQKKRLLQFMFQVDQKILQSFFDKLNNVLKRICDQSDYYVIYKVKLKPAENSLIFREDIRTADTLIQFYRYFDNILEQELNSNKLTIMSFRRVEAVMDLINNFISHVGIIDFDPEYHQFDAKRP